MKNYPIYAFALLVFFIAACQPSQESKDTAKAELELSDSALIKRGEYLVGIMGCQDCHSPKQLGPKGPEEVPGRHLSGYPADRPIAKVTPDALKSGWMLLGGDGTSAVGPWGMSFAANLTSDTTGIGSWSFEQFKIALTQGKSKGIATARPLLPPMPWPNYVNMAEEDLQAVFAYLKSTPPVNNIVPMPIAPDKLQ
ncbi:mono/diheme cytochrome c family protein [Runella defluvii]|uniref:Mono/diheme cytochrome c family protein n=1 Tax=Runella defluvii TaxID=370973 RepID=A0A7W6EN50_9BACT|nr:diheme cytochrome c-553 [Runella defluvii]MBB3836023.1 mono/diheme cytochrome c family protein [Runella defluvii]